MASFETEVDLMPTQACYSGQDNSALPWKELSRLQSLSVIIYCSVPHANEINVAHHINIVGLQYRFLNSSLNNARWS
jgi:hypothetical protein